MDFLNSDCFKSVIPCDVLKLPEYAKFKLYVMDSITFCPRVSELIIRMVDMDIGGQSDAIFSGMNAAVNCLKQQGIEVHISRLSAKDIRENSMTPKDVVDWLLKSHRHFISKSLCLSFIKDSTQDPYVFRSWVSTFFKNFLFL